MITIWYNHPPMVTRGRLPSAYPGHGTQWMNYTTVGQSSYIYPWYFLTIMVIVMVRLGSAPGLLSRIFTTQPEKYDSQEFFFNNYAP